MKRLLTSLLALALLLTPTLARAQLWTPSGEPWFSEVQDIGVTGSYGILVPNEGTTGTTNTLVACYSTAGLAITCATSNTLEVLGPVQRNGGTTGSALIANSGIAASCQFDGATTAGHYVQLSTTVTGNCHDVGAAFPTNNLRVLGTVTTTNGASGVYPVFLYARGLQSGADSATGVGDTAYTILATDQAVYTNAAFSLPRAWTLPAASSVGPGHRVCVHDLIGGVLPSAALTVARAGTNTINGATGYAMGIPYSGACFTSDGSTKWSAPVLPIVAFNGGLNANSTRYWRGDGTWATPTTDTWGIVTGDVTHAQSNTTLSDVTGAAVTACTTATEVWQFEVQLLLTAANTTADWKFGWTVPSGATMFWGPHNAGFSAALSYFDGNAVGASMTALLTESSTLSIGSAAVTGGFYVRGTLICSSASPASVQLQFAQNTSNASDITVKKGSVLIARKLIP